MARRTHRTWANSDPNVNAEHLHVEEVTFTSFDGTAIPMILFGRRDQWRSRPLPTFLTAYGGFGVSRTPQFNAYSTFLVQHGFIFACAILRGGGEFGEAWHRAAKRHNRQVAFDDFVAGAEWLVSNGYSDPERIVIGGGSNAALLVAAAFTQRPDLFRVAVCMGPLLDMVRYHLFDNAHVFVDEYGNAEREDDFRRLLAYSPYHRVNDGEAYPAIMLISGDHDNCCNPSHARKMTARLQAATASGHPVLLDYKSDWGHASVQPLQQRIKSLTDRLAFICHEAGVAVQTS